MTRRNGIIRGAALARRAVAAALAVCLCVLLLGPFAGRSAAQQDAPPPTAADEIDRLIAKLQDPAAREELIRQLTALKEAEARGRAPAGPGEAAPPTLLGTLSQRLQDFGSGVSAIAALLQDLPQTLDRLAARAGDPSVQRRVAGFLVRFVLILAAAVAAEWLARALIARARRALDARAADRLWVRLPIALLRLVIELVPIAAFIVAAYGALPLLEPDEPVGLVALAVVNAHVCVRAAVALARAVLAPATPGQRLVRLSDETANYAVIWVLRLGAVVAYGYFLGDALEAMGVAPVLLTVVDGLLGLLVTALVVVLILQNRQAVALLLSAPSLSARRPAVASRLAEVWHVLAIVYVVAIYLAWLIGLDGGVPFLLRSSLLSLLALVVAAMIGAGLRRAMQRGFSLAGDLRAAFPGLEARANRYLPILHGVLRVVLGLLTLLVILEIWGAGSFDWLASAPGRAAVGRGLAIVLVVAGAFILSELASAVVERLLGRGADGESAAARSARTRTLLPLLRNAFRILLIVVVALVVLSEIGIDIAPLLAGAGVVGLAIGFGAQTLVKDVITGFFILAEDTISIGDVIEVDGRAGVVESMTIRTIRLRDLAGAVFTIPFSSVTTIKNMTKDFSYAVFDVNVSYEAPVDRVLEVLKEIGDDLAADPAFRGRILAPIEILGLDRFADSAMVIRARIKTRPIQQWDVARAFNRRLKARFDREGIEIPYPYRTVILREIRNGARPAAPAADPAAR